MGYSAGGELFSQVLSSRADLFAGYVHSSSRWRGDYDDVVAVQMPVYIFMAQHDDYYGPQTALDAYEALTSRYVAEGLTDEEIQRLVVLQMPDDSYFNRQGIDSYHDSGMVAADDQEVVRWLLNQRKT
jgi:predicted peptidase